MAVAPPQLMRDKLAGDTDSLVLAASYELVNSEAQKMPVTSLEDRSTINLQIEKVGEPNVLEKRGSHEYALTYRQSVFNKNRDLLERDSTIEPKKRFLIKPSSGNKNQQEDFIQELIQAEIPYDIFKRPNMATDLLETRIMK